MAASNNPMASRSPGSASECDAETRARAEATMNETSPSVPTAETHLTLRVRHGWGEHHCNKFLQLTPDMLEWPDDAEGHHLQRTDILRFLRLPLRDECLYDLIVEETGEVWDEYTPLEWGQSYVLHQRTCARCTIPGCSRACTRTTDHRLCAHGGTDHLWHRDPVHSVQGYHKRAGLTSENTGLSASELDYELQCIEREISQDCDGDALC